MEAALESILEGFLARKADGTTVGAVAACAFLGSEPSRQAQRSRTVVLWRRVLEEMRSHLVCKIVLDAAWKWMRYLPHA
jgi:hypothetical protein